MTPPSAEPLHPSARELPARAGGLASYPPVERWDDWEEYDVTAWPRKVKRRYSLIPTICFNCEAACGLLAYVDRDTGKIQKFEGNPMHPGSRGRNCAKGPATLNQVDDPERIRYPLRRKGKRGGGERERVSWDEVLDHFVHRASPGRRRRLNGMVPVNPSSRPPARIRGSSPRALGPGGCEADMSASDYERYRFSIACETDDLAVVFCLRALCHGDGNQGEGERAAARGGESNSAKSPLRDDGRRPAPYAGSRRGRGGCQSLKLSATGPQSRPVSGRDGSHWSFRTALRCGGRERWTDERRPVGILVEVDQRHCYRGLAFIGGLHYIVLTAREVGADQIRTYNREHLE